MIKTPETNISWVGVRGWIAAYHQIFGRRHTSLRYRQLTNHRQALTKDVISEEQDIEALEYITKGDERYFSGSYYGSCPCPGECRCEFTNSRKWWGELQCYAHNRIQCLTFPTRKTIQFMSQTYKTEAFDKMFEAIKERVAEHGEAVKTNFLKHCLKRVNPKVMTVMNIANDTDWKFLPKPDDAPEKGSPEEAKFIADTKDRYYTQWAERIKKGEFDGKKDEPAKPQESKEEDIDMAALARAEKEKAKAEPVTMVNEPEDSRERYEQEDKELVDKVVDKFVKELPDKVEHDHHHPHVKEVGPPSLEHWDKLGPAANLLHALRDFVAATDSTPEDTQDNTEILERITKLEKKVASLFNAMRDL